MLVRLCGLRLCSLDYSLNFDPELIKAIYTRGKVRSPITTFGKSNVNY
ncbi:MAG: hypothetical protein V7L31_10820 [Nostoc sp.]